MNEKSIRTAFPPMKAKVAPTTTTPTPIPPSPAPKQKSGAPKQPSVNDEITVVVELWFEVVNRPEKVAPFWAYLGDPCSDGFGTRCTACLNAAYWPTTAAIERRDLRAIKWFVALALAERVSLDPHPLIAAVRLRLGQLALNKPNVAPWESVLWTAYSLKDTTLFAGLEAAPPLTPGGTLCKFGELSVRVSSEKLARRREHDQAKRSKQHAAEAEKN